MAQKKILVPFGPGGQDMKSVHHALALADRLNGHVVILQWGDRGDGGARRSTWVGEVLADVVANARLAGLSLSHMTVTGPVDEETAGVIEDEGIDLLVLGADDWQLEKTLLHRFPRLSGSIIRVKEKDMESTVEEGGRRWPL